MPNAHYLVKVASVSYKLLYTVYLQFISDAIVLSGPECMQRSQSGQEVDHIRARKEAGLTPGTATSGRIVFFWR